MSKETIQTVIYASRRQTYFLEGYISSEMEKLEDVAASLERLNSEGKVLPALLSWGWTVVDMVTTGTVEGQGSAYFLLERTLEQ